MIITATKDAEGDHEEVTDSYTLYITMKPADKAELVEEIKRAMNAHGDTVDLNYIDTSAITNMNHLFSAVEDDPRTTTVEGYRLGAFNGDISKWNVSNVTKMTNMFSNNTKFNRDLLEWRVGNVKAMDGMFFRASAFNGDISKWDVSAVTTMRNMFFGARTFNGDLSTWDVSAVTNMLAMFFRATAFTGTDLNCWADRIHARIKANSWLFADSMFLLSGVKPLPTWYQTTNTTPPAGCKPVNPKDADRK